jgi:hypothetical protein
MYTIYNEKISEKVQSYYIPKKNAAAVWATGLPSISHPWASGFQQ